MFNKIKQYKQYKKTVRELGNLTNKELNDIGISRYDIDRLAREQAYGV